MTTQTIEIAAQTRGTGKGECRSLRRDKRTPAVVYSPKLGNINFSIREADAVKFSRIEFESSILTLKSEDSKINGIKVLRKDYTVHPVNRRPLHMDFYAVDMSEVVRVNIEIKFDGKSEGEKEGGVFNAVRRELEVECLPNEIPSHILVDISALPLDGSIHVSDLTVPSNVKVITAPELTVCTVAEVREEVAAPAEAAEGEATEDKKEG